MQKVASLWLSRFGSLQPDIRASIAGSRWQAKFACRFESSGVVHHALFLDLGLTDAAIASAARQYDCVVLTDDLPLYVRLSETGVAVLNYTHLRLRFKIV